MEEGPAFAQYIKGWEYIIAIVFNAAFILFWMTLNARRRKKSASSAEESLAHERPEQLKKAA